MNILTNIFNAFFSTADDYAVTADDVLDFYDRVNATVDTTRTTGRFAGVDIPNVQGPDEAQITFDLGDYGTYSVTLDLENEMDSFFNDLGFGVYDLPGLIESGESVAFKRVGGEWNIDWAAETAE